MRTCLIAVFGSLLGASTLAAAEPPPSTRTCFRFSRPTVRPAIGRVKWRRCRSSPTSRPGPGRAPSRPRSPAGRCRPGSPTRTSATSPTSAACVDRGDRDAQRVGRCRCTCRQRSRRAAALTFNNGWNIKPDIIVEMPKPFELPARGTINYKYVLVKTNFPEDMWITAAEMRPGDSRCSTTARCGCGRRDRSGWRTRVPGEAYESESHRDILGRNAIEEGNDILGKFNPGLGAQSFDIEGAAKFVPKGSDLVFELHYTTSGKPTVRRLEARSRAGQGGADRSATSSTPDRRR